MYIGMPLGAASNIQHREVNIGARLTSGHVFVLSLKWQIALTFSSLVNLSEIWGQMERIQLSAYVTYAKGLMFGVKGLDVTWLLPSSWAAFTMTIYIGCIGLTVMFGVSSRPFFLFINL